LSQMKLREERSLHLANYQSLNSLKKKAETDKWLYLVAGAGVGYGLGQMANGNGKEALYGFGVAVAAIGLTYIF